MTCKCGGNCIHIKWTPVTYGKKTGWGTSTYECERCKKRIFIECFVQGGENESNREG